MSEKEKCELAKGYYTPYTEINFASDSIVGKARPLKPEALLSERQREMAETRKMGNSIIQKR